MLELAPETENTVQAYAARAGVSVNDLIARTFPTIKTQPSENTVPDDDPVLMFLNARIQEAENATPEEKAEAEAEWQAFARNMNENRRVNGERLLYPEVPEA